MKIQNIISTTTLLALLFTSPAALAGYTCSGQVKGVAIDVGGDVIVEGIGAVVWPRLCNVGALTNGVTPEACKTIYASLLTAQASGKTVTLWSNDSASSCGTLPQWQFVPGFYFFRVDG